MAIERFRGNFFFLSNMYPLKNHITTSLGYKVPTSEHVYMSERFKNPEVHELIANTRGNPEDTRQYRDGLAAKNLAHNLIENGEEQLDDFDIAKLGIMYVAVKRKFEANADIANLLVKTENQLLVEGNVWNDRFWGVDPPGSSYGLNHLGLILMKVREELT